MEMDEAAAASYAAYRKVIHIYFYSKFSLKFKTALLKYKEL